MKLIDCHNHSKYSMDGSESIRDMIAAARNQGISVLTITDHCEMNEPPEYNLEANINASINELTSLKPQAEICLLAGIELGQQLQFKERAESFLKLFGLDFILASLHNNKDEEDFYYYDFCNNPGNENQAFFERYFKELCEVAANADFDSLAHITYPLRYFYRARLKKPSLKIDVHAYDEAVEQVFKALISRGKSLEFNTSMILTDLWRELPDLRYLELYKALGGELITIGSDAHTKDDIGRGILEAYEILGSIGLKNVCYYKERKPIMVSIK